MPENKTNTLNGFIDHDRLYNLYQPDPESMEPQHLGLLHAPTGHLVVCDPLLGLNDSMPFTRSITPGDYPLWVNRLVVSDAERKHAAMVLQIKDEPVLNWEMALIPGQDLRKLRPDDYFGFPVDAGLACICDRQTQITYNNWADDYFTEHPDGDMYTDFLEDMFRKNARNPHDPADFGEWVDFRIPTATRHNIFMVNSGFGDGTYPCYWGLAADGTVCCLLADFQVL